jgi:hypothetical protein
VGSLPVVPHGESILEVRLEKRCFLSIRSLFSLVVIISGNQDSGGG